MEWTMAQKTGAQNVKQRIEATLKKDSKPQIVQSANKGDQIQKIQDQNRADQGYRNLI